jgi:MFS family permease
MTEGSILPALSTSSILLSHFPHYGLFYRYQDLLRCPVLRPGFSSCLGVLVVKVLLTDLLRGYNLKEYNENVHRFFLFGIPLFAGMMIQSLLYNLYLTRLGYQEDFIGQIAGLYPFASGVFAIPVGYISNRVGRKPFLIATAIVLALTQIGLCTLTDRISLLILSFLAGISGAFLWVNHVPFISENAKTERRAQAIAIWMSLQAITRMVVSLAGGSLPNLMAYFTDSDTSLPETFRYSLLIGAGLCAISILPLIGIQTKPTKLTPEETDSTVAFPTRTFIAYALISVFRGASMGFSFPFFNIFFQLEMGTTTALTGVIFFMSLVIAVPSIVLAPAMARRYGAVKTIVPTRIIGSIALAFLGLTGNLYGAIALTLIAAVVEAITTPTEMTYATQIVPRRYWGRLQSIRVTGFQIPAGIASVVAGFLIVEHGYWATFALAGAFRLVSALFVLIAFGGKNSFRPENESPGLP